MRFTTPAGAVATFPVGEGIKTVLSLSCLRRACAARRRSRPRHRPPGPQQDGPVAPVDATVCGKCHNRPMRFFNTEGPVRPDDGDRWRGRLAAPLRGTANAPVTH